MKVREIGMKDIHCATPGMTLDEVAAMMKRHNVGVIPVCEDSRLLGMITDRDIVISCVAANMDPHACHAREFMTSHPVTVSPDTDVQEAARIMGREQIKRLPVMESDRLVGIVSLGDIAVALQGDEHTVAETLRKISMPINIQVPASV